MLQVIHDNARHYVVRQDQRILAAICPGFNSLFVHPVMTPSGIMVTQERPTDHIHHLGIFVGHEHVNGHNFWWPGPYGYHDQRSRRRGDRETGHFSTPRNVIHCVSLDWKVEGDAVTCRAEAEWENESGEVLLLETRIIRVHQDGAVNHVEVTSDLTPADAGVTLAQTKEAGLAVRVALELESRWGGKILDTEGREGEPQIFDKDSDAIAVHGRVGGRECGMAVIPHPTSARCPWFVRGYGLQNHNPFRHRDVVLKTGERYKLRCLFAAFDGGMDRERLRKMGDAYRKTP